MNARRSASQGILAPYTIPLLADTQARSNKTRVPWSLKFSLPAPSLPSATRRFSAVPEGYGPSGAQALEGAVRYASPFNYQHEATTLLPNSDFLSLPDHVKQYGQVRAQTLGLHIPDSIRRWLLSGAPRIYDRRYLTQPGNSQMALPSILTRYFCSEITIHQFTALLTARDAEDENALDVAATACRQMKRPKHEPFARLPHPEVSTAAGSANTPPPSPRIPDTARSRSPPLGRVRPIGMNPAQPLSEPSSPAVAPSLSTNPPLTVYGGKGKSPQQGPLGLGKGPSKSSKGAAPPPAQDTPFFMVSPQKGKDVAPKGATKASTRARRRAAIKARVKGKVRIRKVDCTRSPPFRLVLALVSQISKLFLLLFF